MTPTAVLWIAGVAGIASGAYLLGHTVARRAERRRRQAPEPRMRAELPPPEDWRW